MDPTLTRSAAHKVFGDLYRKPRPPELQEEVDRIVQSTADIFVRIKRIEELDERTTSKTQGPRDDVSARRGGQGSAGGSTGGRSGKPGHTGGVRKKKSESADDDAPGFFASLFGGELVKWGKTNGTISAGFLGINPHLSSRAAGLFSFLKEEQLISTLKLLRLAVRDGWEIWPPRKYNTIAAALNFFEEYGKMSVILKRERPEDWIRDSRNFVGSYLFLMAHPDYAAVLQEDMIEFSARYKDISGHVAAYRAAVQFLLNLDSRKPTLKSVITAFHVLARKEITDWNSAISDIRVKEPVLDTYRAPENIRNTISGKIGRLRETLSRARIDLQELGEIRKKYFQMDASGKVKVEFLNEICGDVVRRSYPESIINENLIQSHKKEPMKLLWIILKDFDTTVLSMLSGTVQTRVGGITQEVIVFKQGLFKTLMDEFAPVMRDMEVYLKKYKNVSYSFNDFIQDTKKEPEDEILRSFHVIVKKSLKVFKGFLNDLQIIMQNHNSALDAAAAGKGKEKLLSSKQVPIETAAIGMRFLPFYENEIIASNRMNGKTIEKAVGDILMNLYNYIYIFRDPDISARLASVQKLQTDIEEASAALEKMGVKA